MKTYNKLVRDKIPEIIAADGGSCETKTLFFADYLRELDNKLTEEHDEYILSHNVEELADLLEVIYAIAKIRGVSAEKLDALRAEKAEKRGRFEKRIFLQTVRG